MKQTTYIYIYIYLAATNGTLKLEEALEGKGQELDQALQQLAELEHRCESLGQDLEDLQAAGSASHGEREVWREESPFFFLAGHIQGLWNHTTP